MATRRPSPRRRCTTSLFALRQNPGLASSMPSVTQIAAALRRVEEEILRDHVAHCVEYAISSGDKADQRRKIAELMDVVSRADR
jgi:hypothetical protein